MSESPEASLFNLPAADVCFSLVQPVNELTYSYVSSYVSGHLATTNTCLFSPGVPAAAPSCFHLQVLRRHQQRKVSV